MSSGETAPRVNPAYLGKEGGADDFIKEHHRIWGSPSPTNPYFKRASSQEAPKLWGLFEEFLFFVQDTDKAMIGVHATTGDPEDLEGLHPHDEDVGPWTWPEIAQAFDRWIASRGHVR